MLRVPIRAFVALLTGLALAGPLHAQEATVSDTRPEAAAPDQGCRFRGPVLFCGTDAPLEELVRRFADPATAERIRTTAGAFDEFASREARERYRVSVERNNTRSVRLIEEADRLLRAGRIEQDEYDRRLALHRRAFANYRLAIERYERAYWFDPIEPPEDEGTDPERPDFTRRVRVAENEPAPAPVPPRTEPEPAPSSRVEPAAPGADVPAPPAEPAVRPVQGVSRPVQGPTRPVQGPNEPDGPPLAVRG